MDGSSMRAGAVAAVRRIRNPVALTRRILEDGRRGGADVQGRVAAATSTGGMFGEPPGRVGDTPLIGRGTCPDPAGAASCTGTGERIIRVVMGKYAVDQIHGRASPQAAARRAVMRLQHATGPRAVR
ncbi:MAG: isoaspartyl peptidase/L-asparaginase [Acidiferrobacterales bacterium]